MSDTPCRLRLHEHVDNDESEPLRYGKGYGVYIFNGDACVCSLSIAGQAHFFTVEKQ